MVGEDDIWQLPANWWSNARPKIRYGMYLVLVNAIHVGEYVYIHHGPYDSGSKKTLPEIDVKYAIAKGKYRGLCFWEHFKLWDGLPLNAESARQKFSEFLLAAYKSPMAIDNIVQIRKLTVHRPLFTDITENKGIIHYQCNLTKTKKIKKGLNEW